jgi:hypothetical protein
MGADDEGCPAVEVVAEGLLLARRLGMDVHHRGVGDGSERAKGELAVGGGERIVEGVHEDAAEEVDHQDAVALGRVDQAGASPRRSGRVVGGADQPRLPLDEDEGFALVPGMVAEGDRVGPGAEDLVADGRRDAEPSGRVLAVDHHAVQSPALAQGRQALGTARRPGRPTMSPRRAGACQRCGRVGLGRPRSR